MSFFSPSLTIIWYNGRGDTPLQAEGRTGYGVTPLQSEGLL